MSQKLVLPTAILIALTLAAAVTITPAAATHQRTPLENASFVLDWYPNSDHAGLFTAIARGYFQHNHIHAMAYTPSDTSAQIRLVAAGRADFGISYETDLLAARVHHIPVQSVMCIMQHPLDTVMTLRSSGIRRPRQLVGKTVGMAGSPSDNSIVSAMMSHDGASIRQARMVNVGYNLLLALLTRRVDAVVGVYWTWEAIQARQKGFPVNVMRVEQWGVPNYCELVLVANEHTIRTRPTYVRKVVQGLQQGYAYAEAHPAAGFDALKGKASGLNRTLVVSSIKLLAPVVTGAPTIGYQNAAQWSHYARWLVKSKLVDGPVDARAAFTNQFLRPDVR